MWGMRNKIECWGMKRIEAETKGGEGKNSRESKVSDAGEAQLTQTNQVDTESLSANRQHRRTKEGDLRMSEDTSAPLSLPFKTNELILHRTFLFRVQQQIQRHFNLIRPNLGVGTQRKSTAIVASTLKALCVVPTWK